MRSFLLLLASILALAAACGGKTSGTIGNPGDGGSSSSSGGSGSSGGSSTSGSSSGGVTCTPLPGCSSSLECPSPDGCGECYCEGGQWACAGTGCGDDVSDAFPVDDSPSGSCPFDPPEPGTFCAPQNLSCGYGGAEGCGETCECQNVGWECFPNPCPPPPCPPSAPPDGSICTGVGSSCFFPIDSGCGYEECDCDPSGTWGCYTGSCVDAGPPTDAGIFDAGPCPGSEPPQNAACPEQGLVCEFFEGCQVNCLCTSTGWVCASQGPC